MQQLREQHQRRHASRQGVYVTEDAEERAELQLRQVGGQWTVEGGAEMGKVGGTWEE